MSLIKNLEIMETQFQLFKYGNVAKTVFATFLIRRKSIQHAGLELIMGMMPYA